MKLLKAEIVENKLTIELDGNLDQMVDLLTTIKYNIDRNNGKL